MSTNQEGWENGGQSTRDRESESQTIKTGLELNGQSLNLIYNRAL